MLDLGFGQGRLEKLTSTAKKVIDCIGGKGLCKWKRREKR
jgi:hypothetical protein